MNNATIVQVYVLRGLAIPLTYSISAGMELCVGDIVEVPLGSRKTIGVVWELVKKQEPIQEGKKYTIKPVLAKYDVPSLSPALLRFITKVAEYCVADIPSVLKMVLSIPKALEVVKIEPKYELGMIKGKLTAQRQKVIEYAKDFPGLTLTKLHKQTGVSKAIIRALITAGALVPQVEDNVTKEIITEILQPNPPQLSKEQQEAADQLCTQIKAGGYHTTLIDGVTGSGKTEVYFAAIEEACKNKDGQVLVLLPEIALTTQWIRRFKERFGVAPLQWHSNLSSSKRIAAWRDIVGGKARIIVGARSALFLPYKNLKLIVIDEEHDGSFKQEEGVIYHGRDMAIVRAFVEKFPVILASATPSIETVNNVRVGKYQELKLPGRFNASMPHIEIIDMRKSEKQSSPWISQTLASAIHAHLTQGQQVLLFLNRRGYAPLTLCKDCGHRFQCTSCSGWLVRHESPARLRCHRCGYHQAIPEACTQCNAEESLVSCGPGIQRIGEAVHKLWPGAKVALMDSAYLAQDEARDTLIQDITQGKVDIIIGTQVIAKGHHFPKLALVGIIDADVGLSGGDLRAAERCFQLLHQVSGRAGREKTQGRVLIQSYMPENSVIKALASGDRDTFVASEMYSREIANMPPFSRLVAILISGENKEETEVYARKIVQIKPCSETIDVFGPVPAALFIIRKQYRFCILVKAPININVQRWVEAWLMRRPICKSVHIKIDVDPYNFG